MSDLTLLLIILFSILGISLIVIWKWFIPRLFPDVGKATYHRKDRDERLEPLSAPNTYAALMGKESEAQTRKLQILFFTIGLVVYLITRFVDLERFPITFFADEAAQTVIAAELVENGLRYQGELLPTYFQNVDKYSLSVTVYLQVIPFLLFGKSILVTRATSVLVSLIGVIAISLTLKNIFKSPYWWSGVLWLMLSPAWFMHSRTAFETPIAASLFALFIFFYLLYLYRSPRYFAHLLITGALTFYAYNPARVIVTCTVVLLAISDREYHWRNRRLIAKRWWLILLCVLPYGRFFIQHPFSASDQMILLNSYWVQNIPLAQKFLRFSQELLRGVSPLYWYFPNQHDLIRHIMKGYGHIFWFCLPFAVWGVYTALKYRRVSAYRVLLIALICAPLGGAIVETSVTRSLPFIIPATLLTAIGFTDLMQRVALSHRIQMSAAFALLVISVVLGAIMTSDAVRNGPTWYSDYGLYGMQYGSPQVFKAVDEIAKSSPGVRIIASPLWANGTSMLARFFLDDLEPLWWGVIDDFLAEDYPIDDMDVFIMLVHEYVRASTNEEIDEINVRKIIYYPDGEPGFYIATVKLTDTHTSSESND